jgi:GT2 family glycosyltransferase
MLEFGIVNFNGGEALTKCVRSILSQDGEDVSVVVFDNASTDDSFERLKASNLPVRLVRSRENLGYAGACNRLWKSFSGEYVVLCNMDLEFDEDWAHHVLATFARHPNAWAVSPLCLEKGDVLRVNSRGLAFFWDLQPQNVDSGKVWNAEEDGEEREIFGCYGAAMALRRSALETLGGFDEDYFLFYEETDLAWRAALMGWPSILQPKAVVRHERSMTTVRYSPFKLFYSERNRVRTAVKILPLWYLPLLPLLTALRLAIQSGKGGVPSHDGRGARVAKRAIIGAIAKGWLAALRCLPRDLGKRRALWNACAGGTWRSLDMLRRHSLRLSELSIR